jgi:hypothetical protein
MATHTVKTTIDISDAILEKVKALAAREGTTVRALVEDGLRQLLKTRRAATEFHLREASFAGHGLNPHFRDAAWDEIRDAIYETET